MRTSQEKALTDESEKPDGVLTISADSVLSPLILVAIRLLRTIVNRLAVVLLLGFGGIVAGAVLGLSTGPGIAITTAVGGAIGLLIGGWWEYRRLKSGQDYDDLLD